MKCAKSSKPHKLWILVCNAGRTTKFAPVKSLRFSELILGILLFEFRFTVFFPLGCGVDSWIPPLSFVQTAKGKAPKEAWGSRLSGESVNVTFLRLHEPQLTATRCVSLNQIDASYVICIWFFMVLCPHYSTLSSPLPFRCDKIFRKGRIFQSFVWIGFYQKAVSGVVKSWEFEGILRCSKILRIRRENPMKWVFSISRDYWVYLDITLQSFEIWEFWGEFWGIETFYQSKLVLRPA